MVIFLHWLQDVHRPVFWVCLFNSKLMQNSNQPFTWWQLGAFREVDMVEKTCKCSDWFEFFRKLLIFLCRTIFSERTSSEQQFSGGRCLEDGTCQITIARVIQTERKATVCQITTDIGTIVYEWTIFKQIGYSSRRAPQTVCHTCWLRTRKLGYNWQRLSKTKEESVIRSKSRFLLYHLDGQLRIQHKQQESMDRSWHHTVLVCWCGKYW